ncbi:LPXTG cell wall anchor domain-containing protein [Niallia oryzisoli]|uniref:LPXTG cell wall anchor domain-containing protein n=1 Tax=Niallia oryzisoli TaxID=1737571 RepID=UPI003734C20F
MKKNVIVKSLKSVLFTGVVAAGIMIGAGAAGAEENAPLSSVTSLVGGAASVDSVTSVLGTVTSLAPVGEVVSTVGGVLPVGDVVAAASSIEPIGTVTSIVTSVVPADVIAPVAPLLTSTAATEVSAASSIIPEEPPVVTGNPEAKDPKIISEEKSSVVNLSLQSDLLRPITGDVNVDVLGSTNVETKEGKLSSKGLVQADLTDSKLLGNTHAGVLEEKQVTTKDYEYNYNGVVNVTVKESIVGDAHAGVIESESVKTDKYTWTHDGLVIVDTNNTPIVGDLHAGVLENEKYVANNPGTDNPGTDNPGTDNPGTDNPGTDNPGTDNPGTDKPGTDNPGTDNPGTDKPNTDNNNPGKNDDKTNNDGKNNTTTPVSNVKNNNGNNNGNGNTKVDTAVSNTLPKTGSAMDSTILVLVSFMVMAVGLLVRKWNRA